MMLKKTAYLFAGCIIFIAIIVAASRLVTPILDQHRADIETWASTLLKLPVTVKQVRISWYQYQPEISLNEVTINNKDTKEPILQIQRVRIFFSIPQSLYQWKLIPSGIMISGTDIDIYEKTTGEMAIQGFPSFSGFNNQPYKNETKFADVMGWLSGMPRLILNNIDLRYTDQKGIKRFLTLYNLRFENSKDKHIILGKALLHQALPTEATVTVEWEGTEADLNKIHAKAYLFVSGLSLDQWLKGYSWQGWHLISGSANTKIWAIWNNGTFQKIQSAFEAYGLDFYSDTDKSSHKIGRLSGDVGWKRDGNNQIFAGEDIFINLPSHLWPSTSFYLSLAPDKSGKLLPTAMTIGYADLADVQTFLFSSPPILPNSLRTLLSELKLKGDIQSVSAIFSSADMDAHHISMNGNVSGLSVSPWHHFPGIQNLSGIIKWNGSQGDLSLHSNQIIFQYNSIFTNPITIDQLSGDIIWQMDPNKNWVMRLQSLQAFNNDAAINANGTFVIPPVGSVVADMTANLTVQRASHVVRYLPMRLFDPGLVEWLNHAFLSGAVQSGTAVLRGPLNDFPFNKGNGQFLISGAIKNLNLHFAPHWPLLKNLNGKVVFLDQRMTVDVDHVDIDSIPIEKVHGEIPYLSGTELPILKVQTGEVKTDFTKGLNFVHASPLEQTIGKMFTGTNITGPMVLKLALTVPLKKPDNTSVQGNITFKDTQLNLVPWNLLVNHLRGELHFTEKTTDATNIQGDIFNKPLQLNLQTIQKNNTTSVVRAVVTHNLDIDDIEKWLKIPFAPIVKGSTNVVADIDFSVNAPLEVHLQSNLLGIAVDLPDQYAKTQEQARDFSADITIQDKQPLRVKMNYGNLLGAALVLDRKDNAFSLTGADLHLGSGSAAWPASSGFYITGNLTQLDWDKIKLYLNQAEMSHFSGLSLRGIDVFINKLILPGQELTQTRLKLTASDNRWEVGIIAPQVVGQIQIPTKFSSQSMMTAQFQKLDLQPVANVQTIGNVDVTSLPSISFNADDVSYNKMRFGQVSFKTVHSKTGLSIQSLTVHSPRIELTATGDWTPSGTRLQGSATSPNVSDLLNSLGFDTHNFVSSKGHFTFKFSWNAAPYALTLASMNGQASLDLGPGRIVELSQTSGAKMDLGRMLNIFSLQTIPRRLSLDFSDMFQKGYSFDALRGDFKFTNGDAYTNNTRFDGPVARVDIYGRIGFAKKDYDLTLSVTPYVTSSIPVAATLLTGQPVIGIAAWAVDKVISSSVSKVTTHYYSVGGSWTNPTWGSITAPKKRE